MTIQKQGKKPSHSLSAKPWRTLLWAAVVGTVVLGGDARADTDAAERCDQLAANTDDPQRTHTGVKWEDLDAAAATSACRLAIQTHPNVARLQYQYGRGLQKAQNYPEALKWYHKAADQGYAPAQSALGRMYYEGSGVPKNSGEAERWFRSAAEQGYAPAQNNLGWILQNGNDDPKNLAEAVRLYRLAAEQGHAYAQTNLGRMYERGRGVSLNFAEAVRLYRLAADQGNAVAQNNLGFAYENGQGVPRNLAEAVRLYRLAADQGYAVAQANLRALAAQTEPEWKAKYWCRIDFLDDHPTEKPTWCRTQSGGEWQMHWLHPCYGIEGWCDG